MPSETCTMQLTDRSYCREPGIPDSPIPICVMHAATLYGFLRDRIGEVEGDIDRAVAAANAVRTSRSRSPRSRHGDHMTIYYVQVGDLIKIGITSNLGLRLKAYPPHRRCLATERGGTGLEAQRHQQFAQHLASGNEWFRPSVALLDHINGLRQELGAAPIPSFAPLV